MDTTVQVAIIAAAATIVGGVISLILNKRAERADLLTQRKLQHYQELLVLRHIQELGFVFRQFRGEWMEHKEVFHAEEVYRSLVET
jgi:hypothetical protein